MGVKRALSVAVLAVLIVQFSPSAQAKAKGRGRAGMSVVALIDSGINPYAEAFRDRSPLAYKHPSTYIPGYPKKAKPLRLSLGLPYKKAFKKDAGVWKRVTRGQLYWIPGTRIVGAITLDSGGTNCPPAKMPPVSYLSGDCREYPILDDHGHGTMTASRAAGAPRSLAPNARIVEIEGLGSQSVAWAADQGWIDVQSNSWLSLVPPPIPSGTSREFEEAAAKMLTLAGSGNGTAYITGFAPTPTYVLSTAAPGVVLVGGHDNGKMTLWAGAPPHVVADAYSGFTALRESTGGMKPNPMACCTSASSPYAAGGAAAIVAEARRLLGHHGTGVKAGLVACGEPGRIKRGPLKDGVFTLAELKTLFFKTAQPHPVEGRDDGRIHWAGDPRPPDNTEYGPGGNPFCIGCTTTPVAWKDIPDDGDAAFPLIGYGGINEHSVALAKSVLSGKKPLPERPAADAQYELDQQIREVVFSANSPDQPLDRPAGCRIGPNP
ncbi:MAG: S8/S53 family peptidase [Actinomycetota bacterium]|nr:S8/S53 family peptidase [Actinomycetota bacterium]